MLSVSEGVPIGKIVDSKQFPKIGGKSVYLGLVDLEFDDDGMTSDFRTFQQLPEIVEPEMIPVVEKSAKKIVKGIKKGFKDPGLFKCFELRKTTSDRIEPVPMVMPESRNALYITGKAGAGKSHFTKLYLNNYIAYFPENPIYLFSRKPEDELFTPYEKSGKITRIPIRQPEYLQMVAEGNGLNVDDFNNCLVIFDDCSKIEELPLKKHLDHLRDQILEIGRSQGVYIITTTHIPCNGHDTKMNMIESSHVVFFPSKMNHNNMVYMLGNVFGLTNAEIKRIKALRTKYWVMLYKDEPRFVMYEKGCYMLD